MRSHALYPCSQHHSGTFMTPFPRCWPSRWSHKQVFRRGSLCRSVRSSLFYGYGRPSPSHGAFFSAYAPSAVFCFLFSHYASCAVLNVLLPQELGEYDHYAWSPNSSVRWSVRVDLTRDALAGHKNATLPSTAFANCRLESGRQRRLVPVKAVAPVWHDGRSVAGFDVVSNSVTEFRLVGDTDVTQHRASIFEKKIST
jgi:hypothetical protein